MSKWWHGCYRLQICGELIKNNISGQSPSAPNKWFIGGLWHFWLPFEFRSSYWEPYSSYRLQWKPSILQLFWFSCARFGRSFLSFGLWILPFPFLSSVFHIFLLNPKQFYWFYPQWTSIFSPELLPCYSHKVNLLSYHHSPNLNEYWYRYGQHVYDIFPHDGYGHLNVGFYCFHHPWRAFSVRPF